MGLPVAHGVDVRYPNNEAIALNAINAPATILWTLAYVLPWYPLTTISRTLGLAPHEFDLYDLLFLFGVGLLWYSVGRAIDHRKAAPTRPRPTVAIIAFRIFSVLLGVWLFVRALFIMSDFHPSNDPQIIGEGIFTLAWSLILISPPVRKLIGVIRRKTPRRPETVT